MSSLSTSLASLSYRSTVSDAGYCGHEKTMQRRPVLLENREEVGRTSSTEACAFSEEVIPQAGFLSVVDLYPDSHWPDVSDILQPQMVLEPSYRSDLKSCQGSEVYRYPSPLHAVALQSPLYAPKSPTAYRKRRGSSPGGSTLITNPMPRPDCVPVQRGCCHSQSSTKIGRAHV